jgi:predicted transcriptional regulator
MKRIFHFRASSSQLGPLEERLLEALWERGPATVRDLVNPDGACHDLAYTTVMTTLDRLFKKNLLSREAEGRAFRYTPRFTREELHREVAGAAFRRLLHACPSPAMLRQKKMVDASRPRFAASRLQSSRLMRCDMEPLFSMSSE